MKLNTSHIHLSIFNDILYGTSKMMLVQLSLMAECTAPFYLTLTMRRAWADDNLVKNVSILEFGYYIWNPYKKSTNMPGIGSLFCEIDVNISEFWKTNILFG